MATLYPDALARAQYWSVGLLQKSLKPEVKVGRAVHSIHSFAYNQNVRRNVANDHITYRLSCRASLTHDLLNSIAVYGV